MKRDQRIWMVIALILVVGVCFTGFTRRLVDRQETAPAELNITENTVGPGGPAAADKEPSAFAAQAPAAAETVSETTLSITPVAPAVRSAADAAADTPDGKHRYLQRLAELDTQIEQNRASNKDKTTNTLKVNAEYELRVWETEMDAVLEILSARLNTEKYEDLLAGQRVWIRERESVAMEASRKHSGSALESVEYTASLSEQTRNRVYTIVDEFRQMLEDA